MKFRTYILLYIISFYSLHLTAQETQTIDSLAFFITAPQYLVSPINVNSQNSDFSPIIFDNKLLFTSGRENQIGVIYKNKNELLDLFVSNKIDSITFSEPKSFSTILNTKYNDGPASLNSTNDLIVYTSNVKSKLEELKQDLNEKKLQLYQSEFKNGKWTSPQLLNFCKPEFSYCHPFFANDNKTLYFSSDLENGFGGMDLYVSKYENSKWSTPQNLGPSINSEKNEVFPSFTNDGILYFSCDKDNGYGGLDIYSIVLNDSINAKLHLLEQPINSEYDDFGIFIEPSGNSGYFSSNRNNNNSDNIFYFKNNFPYFNNCMPFVKPSYCFTFFEETSIQSYGEIDLVYEWNLGDGTKIKNIEAKHCFERPGDYLIELNIVENASGNLFYNEASYEFTIEDSAQLYINSPDTVIVNIPFEINSDKSQMPGFTLEKFTWKLEDNNYAEGKYGKYKYSKEGNYNLSLGILAKNDSSGAYKSFCIEKNITVVGNSWKKTNFIKYDSPSNIENIFSTENVDSLNFRVFLGSSDVQIPLNSDLFIGLEEVKESKSHNKLNYTSGKTENTKDIVKNYQKAKEKGFDNAVVVGFSGDTLLPNQEKSTKNIQLKENYDTVLLSNIYFELNKYSISKEHFKTLDSISNLIRINPLKAIVLYSFTDSVGDMKYNINLSDKRAHSVKKYITSKGVKSSKINIVSLGEGYRLRKNRQKYEAEKRRRVSIYLYNKK